MERIVHVRIEKLPEGPYLATSEEVEGLVAQARTITETLEIARDVARRLLEAQAERNVRLLRLMHLPLAPLQQSNAFSLPESRHIA